MLVALPLLIPLATAAACVLAWPWRFVQRWLGIGGALALLAVSINLLRTVSRDGIIVMQVGNWPAPFGITLVADMLSAIMIVIAGIVGALGAIYSAATIDALRESFGYYALFHILLLGTCGSFLTGDIFNLFVWFEVLLIASFVLLALGGERPQIEGALKYVTLNLISSAIFLTAVGLLYGVAGTLNMADLAVSLPAVPNQGLVTVLAVLFLFAFGIKAALFPLFFWLPASYHTPPAAVSAVFAALLTKVGVYGLLRVFTLMFVQDTGYTHKLILLMAGFTMVYGVFGAMTQNEFRRILSFHIVSQIGYMIMGLGLYTPLALGASIYFTVHNIFAKSSLFLVSGIARRYGGGFELKKLGGLYKTQPALVILFLLPALSLAGIPPLSGFFGKLFLIRAGLETHEYAIVVVALLVSVLTLFSMLKIWAEVFWKPMPGKDVPLDPSPGPPGKGAWLALTLMVGVMVAMGIAVNFSFGLAAAAGEQIFQPTRYIEAVLGARP